MYFLKLCTNQFRSLCLEVGSSASETPKVAFSHTAILQPAFGRRGEIKAKHSSMKSTSKQRPSVSSSSAGLYHGGDIANQGAGGAKNLWIRTGHQWNLTLGTYNVRSLSTDYRLTELEHELKNIAWDIIGLSEVRRSGIEYITLKSGHKFFYSGNNSGHGGVGFLINKALAGNVVKIKGLNERICMLTLELSNTNSINVIQVYAPTCSHEDAEVEELYDKISSQIAHFNAKVGQQRTHEFDLGKFGLGKRNTRGQMLIEFASRNKIKIMNTFS